MYICVTKVRNDPPASVCKDIKLKHPTQNALKVPLIHVTSPTEEMSSSIQCVKVRGRDLSRPVDLPELLDKRVIPYGSHKKKYSPLQETSFLNFVPERVDRHPVPLQNQSPEISTPEESIELQVKLDLLTNKQHVDIIVPQKRLRHCSFSAIPRIEKPDLLKSLPDGLDRRQSSTPDPDDNEIYSPIPCYSANTLDIFLMSQRSRSSTFSYFGEIKKMVKIGKKNPKQKDLLYHLQEQAPKPNRIICEYHVPDKPPHYGREFHGPISRETADWLMTTGGEGSYLVRESLRAPGSYTLGLRCNHSTKNFRLYFDGKHYVADKRFDTLHELVEDGLITMYVEANAADYINEMVAEPIYEKHAKYSTVRENERNTSLEHEIFDLTDGRPGKNAPVISESTNVEASTYEKAHNFKIHSFGGLNWCEYCGNFMWGLKNQGVKCSDCGLSTHKQCSKLMPQDCTPSMRLLKRIFSIDLTTLVKAQNTMRPVVIDRCIEELESRGLNCEGLYRVPGLQDDVDRLRQRFDMDGGNAKINTKDFPDINVISGVLKLYLRQLPIPLVPFDLFGVFMDAVQNQDDNMRIDALHEAILQLHETKPAHFHTLKHIVAHLNRVTQFERQNRMNVENISIVFGPTIFRSPTPFGDLHMLEFEKKCVELMITHQSLLFDISQSYV